MHSLATDNEILVLLWSAYFKTSFNFVTLKQYDDSLVKYNLLSNVDNFLLYVEFKTELDK